MNNLPYKGSQEQTFSHQHYSQSLKQQKQPNTKLNFSPTFFDNMSFNTIDVPQQTLVYGTGQSKNGPNINLTEVVILTLNKFGDVPVNDIKKLKVYKKCQKDGHHTLKIQSQIGERIWYFGPNQCYYFAYSCIWAKLLTLNIQVSLQQQFINACEGQIYKKSQIIKQWEPRYLLITEKDGLMSHRNKNQAATLHIQSIEELWTRFQIIEGNKFIVFKLWYSIIKQQFAVPLYRAVKWFKAFYSLLRKQ